MKKILSIALIAALVLTSAFAAVSGFKGDATLSLGYDLDSTDYGFTNGSKVEAKWGFELDSAKAGSEGEGDLKAVIAAEFKAEIAAKKFSAPGAVDVADLKVSKLKITKADIVYKDMVTFGLLSAGTSANYAASYYDDDEDGDPDSDVVTGLKGVPGFTVKADVANGGFGLMGNAEAKTFALLAHVALSETEVAEGVKVAAGAAVIANQDGAKFAVNGKASYAKDLFSADVAADLNVADVVALEAALNAAYDFVSANVYFYTEDGFTTNNLDALLCASKTIEDVEVSAFVETRNVLADARSLDVGATAEVAVDALKVKETASYSVFDKAAASTTTVTYTADLFKAEAKVALKASFADSFEFTSIKPSLTVSSDKLVDNATLSLGWTGAEFAGSAKKNGAITAAAKVSFK